MEDVRQIPQLIRQLLQIVKELERRFPGRRFTLDGHLVGSLGEVFAAHCYELELLSVVTKKHDARTQDGRFVQITVIIGRIFYAVLLFAYMFFAADFPITFLPTGIIDLAWTTLYIVLTLISDQVRFRDLFLPYRGDS